MEEYIITTIISMLGYEIMDKKSIYKVSDTQYYVKAAFGHDLAVDLLCDKIEEFKFKYPQIIEYINIDLDDDGTTNFVENIKIKIVFNFKDLNKINQLAAYLKLI